MARANARNASRWADLAQRKVNMPKGISLTQICPQCGLKGLRHWVGNDIEGDRCWRCKFERWYKKVIYMTNGHAVVELRGPSNAEESNRLAKGLGYKVVSEQVAAQHRLHQTAGGRVIPRHVRPLLSKRRIA